ncbi:MAG: hypothetical protein WCP19_06280, partial [Chloroflexota bacterium]
LSDELVNPIAAEKNLGTPIVFTPTTEHASELISTIASDFIPVNMDAAVTGESGLNNKMETQESEHGVRHCF